MFTRKIYDKMLKCKMSKADSPDCGNNTTTLAGVVVSNFIF